MSNKDNTILLVGGGIGGMAAALALSQAGYEVDLMEQAPELGEIGAGIQLGPNAFAAMDVLAAARALVPAPSTIPNADDGCARRIRGRPHGNRRGVSRAL